MVNVKYCILGVEGPHDQAFVGKLLKQHRLAEFNGQRKSLDAFWEKFIPTYPRSGRLHDRLDMPSIFFSSTHSIAVYQGGNPQQKATKNAKELREIYPGLVDEPGKVVAGKPRTGIYVFAEVALLGEFLKDLLELPES